MPLQNHGTPACGATSQDGAQTSNGAAAVQLHSARSGRLSQQDDANLGGGRPSGPPSSRAASGDPITRPAVPTLRFTSDNVYATEAELAAKAAASARLRADLDRQVAEKQLRREQERGEDGDTVVRPTYLCVCL